MPFNGFVFTVILPIDLVFYSIKKMRIYLILNTTYM